MNIQDLVEHKRRQNIIESIAQEIVHARRRDAVADGTYIEKGYCAKDTAFGKQALNFSVDEVDLDDVDIDGTISVKCTEYGSYGYYEGFTEKIGVNEFTDPKWMLMQLEDEAR